MKVSELITLLQTKSPDLQVAYNRYSDLRLMEPDDIDTFVGCEPNSDGWIQNPRPDKPVQVYLCFPGN